MEEKKDFQSKYKQTNWKKVGKFGLISIGSLAVLSYGLLFTKPGNSVMSSYVQSLLNTDPKVPIIVETFRMDTDNVELVLKVSDVIDARLNGDFSLFSGDFDGDYIMKINDLSRINIKELKEAKASGAFETKGKIKSSNEGYILKGHSGLYNADLNYNAVITGTKLKTLHFDFENLNLGNMLKHTKQMQIADAKIDISGDIKNAHMGKLDGKIITKVSDGKLNSILMKKLYGHDIPEDFTFATNINTDLKGKKAISKIDISNTYSKIVSDNLTIDLENENLSGDYKLDIFNLSNFIKVPQTKLKGAITSTGKVSGTIQKAILNGVSNLYNSDTKYTIALDKDEVKSIKMHMNGISLKQMAKQNAQESILDGRLNVKVDIKDAREGKLNGIITSNLRDININKDHLKKQYDINIPNTLNLEASNNIKLSGNNAIINSHIKTNVATLNVNDLIYNVKTKTSKGKYILKSASFENLVNLSGLDKKLLTQIKQDGKAIELTGNIIGGKSSYIDGKAEFLNGILDFVYMDEKLKVNLLNSGIKLVKDNKIVYNSSINGRVNFDIKKEDLNLYLTLNQGDTLLKIENAKFDLKNNKTDAKVVFSAYDKTMSYLISGDSNNPDISLKANKPLISKKYLDFMKNEIEVNLEDKNQKENLFKLLSLLSKPNATLTKKDMQGVETALNSMLNSLKKEYSKFKNVKFTKEHLENLQEVAEKINKEKAILSKRDIKEVELRSKAIVEALKKEWSNEKNVEDRKKVLNYFSALGKKLSSVSFLTKEEVNQQKIKLSKVLDSYQKVVSNKNLVNKELKKYTALIKMVKLIKKDEKFNQEKIYSMIDDFNNLLDFVQYKIVNLDATDEQIRVIKNIGNAIQQQTNNLKSFN